MDQFRISVDLSMVLNGVSAVINDQVFPLLAQAVRGVAQQTAANWRDSVHHAKLWSGERDAYADAIQWKETGPFAALVWSDYKYDEQIEGGRPARDLKRYLDTSHKVRLNQKTGKRYLIIPFRHNVPGQQSESGTQMPKEVYDVAKDLKPSMITGQTNRISGLMASDIKTRKLLTVKQNLYSWGDRMPAGFGPRFTGMYRFHAETPGGKRYSTYLTFRVMTQDSNGWIIPPQPAMRLAEDVTKRMRPLAEKAFQEAVTRTLH